MSLRLEPVTTTTRKFNVYVVELEPAAAKNPGRGCLYVGETATTPEDRWRRHRSGGRTAAQIVARYGHCLRPDLSSGIGPFATRTEAVQAETELAVELRRQGYVVYGGQGHTFNLGARKLTTAPPPKVSVPSERRRAPTRTSAEPSLGEKGHGD